MSTYGSRVPWKRGRTSRPTSLRLEPLEPRVLLSATEPTLQVFNASPALFAANLGQWQDASVRYVFEGSGGAIAHTDAGPVFQLSQLEQTQDGEEITQSISFSVTFEGAESVWPVGQDPSQAVYNYYVGDASLWRAAVPTFQTVAYPDLWSGIDLLTWGRRDGLKYEFHVAPGADPGQIRLHYEGIEGLSLDESGALHIATALGEVVDDAPFIYQEIGGQRVQVAGAFQLFDAGTYGFGISGSYDPQAELVIDPELAWSSYLGGSADEHGTGIAVDSSGDAFITGSTLSADFPTPGGDDTSLGGSRDAFVTKVSGSGALLWSTYLGGSGDDGACGIAKAGSGDVFITGYTVSPDFPTPGGFDTTYGGGSPYGDAFVARVSGSGALVWSSYLGGSGSELGFSVAVDGSGNAFIAGYTYSSDFPTPGGFDTTRGGTQDAFVTKVSGSGALLWSSYLGGSDVEYAKGIAVDGSDSVLIAGYTYSSDFPTPGGFDTTRDGSQDAFVTKVSGSGGLLWSSYLGGSGVDNGYAIAVDRSGDAFITGYTASADFPTPGGFDTLRGGSADAFVTKVRGTGGLLWSSYLGGSMVEEGFGITLDASGNAFIAGDTYSTDFPAPGGFDTTLGGVGDAIVTEVSGSGALVWSTYLGGSDWDGGNSITVDGLGNVFIVGFTYSPDFPTSGGFDTTLGGTIDAFVTKITYDHPPSMTTVAALPGGVEDTDFTITYQTLADAADEADVDGDLVSFRIEAVSSGTLTKGGVAVVPGATLLSAGQSLVWHPAANANGTLGAFTVKAWDGQLASAAAVPVSVQVTPVNDVPSFTKGGNQAANEDAGLRTVMSWATGVSAGPANESGQSVDFLVTNDNNSLFSSQPVIAANGTLTYTSAANANGSATVTVRLHDDGGTSNGGVDTSAPQTFTITVNPVNDVPSFTKGSNQAANEDAGLQTVVNWATGISAGPANESGQSVDFLVTNDNNGLFSSQPAIAANGTLTYTAAANANGSATVTVRLDDDGGTSNGGVDTSAPQTFTITVNPVNDAPVADGQSPTTAEDTALPITLTGSDGDPEVTQVLTFAIVTGPSHGTLSGFDPATGAVTYTPAGNYNGPDSFTFTVTDDAQAGAPANLTSASATVSLTVTAVNDAPVADGQGASLAEDTAKPITLTGSDGDPEVAQVLTFAIVTGPSHGTLSGFNSATGAVTYTPAGNYNGADSFTFTVTDDALAGAPANLTSALATVSLTVTAVNDAPTANAQATGTPEDTALAITLTGADGDPELTQVLTFAIVTDPSHGTLSGFNPATGAVTYTPAGNYNGADSFTFTVTDDALAGAPANLTSAPATVSLTVTAVNDAPVADDQSPTTAEDTAKPITLTGNDSDPEVSQVLTFAIATGPSHGTLSGFDPATGAVTYTPAGNYNGPDSFTFTVTDDALAGAPANLTSAPATVSLTVTAVNDAPTANAQATGTPEDTALAITLTGADGDPELTQVLTFAIVTDPSHGTLSGFNAATGAVTYTPAAYYNGPDSFTFTVTDDAQAGPPANLTSAPATVSLTVTAVNDAPVADAQSPTTAEDTALPITLTGADGDPEVTQVLTFAIVTGPSHGTLSGFNSATGAVTYTPAGNYNGSDSFTFAVTDDALAGAPANLTSSPATVSLTVTPVNDAPAADAQSPTTTEDTALPITLTGADSDPEVAQVLTFAIVTGPSHGTLSGFNAATGAVTYTPAGNYNGPDSFTFTVTDDALAGAPANLTSSAATVSLTVTPVNDAPVADGQGVGTPEDTALPITLVGSDGDPEVSQALTFAIVTGPSHGTLSGFNSTTGAVTYTPTGDYNGPDSFTFTVTDDALAGAPANLTSASATVSLTVTPVNDAPVADGQSPTTAEDTALPLTLTGADGDPEVTQVLTFAIATGPSHGTLSGFNSVTGAVTYTPNANYNGPDSFTFTVTDDALAGAPANLTSASATVSLTVTAVNDAPTANAQATGTPEDTALPITLTGADGDPEVTQVLTFAIVTGPTHGTLSGFNAATGAVTYTPDGNYNGPDSFTFTVTDDALAGAPASLTSAPATVSLTVTVVNYAPVVSAVAVATHAQVMLHFTAADFAASFSDPDPGDTLQVVRITSLPGPGTLSLNGTPVGANQEVATGDLGGLTYDPMPGFVGTASFGWTGSDGTEFALDDALVTVAVNNEEPVLTRVDALTGAVEDADFTIAYLTLVNASDASDADGDPISFSVEAVGSGTLLKDGAPVIPGNTLLSAGEGLVWHPAPDTTGTLNAFTLRAWDGFGPSAGAATQVRVAVEPVNDAPWFTKGADQEENEDAGEQAVAEWATAIAPGPADESGQTVWFEVTTDNPGLFAAAPALTPAGELHYRSALNAHGVATVTVVLHDDGGTAGGGVDTSAPQTFTITVRPANDAPSFVKGGNRAVDEDAGPQAVPGWATGMSPGPADEAGQAVWFEVVGNDSPGLFAVQPAVSADGTLTFTPRGNANGTATVAVVARDDGGTANGGNDTSAPQTFTITLQPILRYVGSIPAGGGAAVYVYDCDRTADVTLGDVVVKPGKGGSIASITIIGTQPIGGLGLVISGAASVGAITDARLGALGELGFIASACPVSSVSLKTGLAGYDLNGLTLQGVVLAADLDGDGDTNDLTGLVLGGSAKAVAIGGHVRSELVVNGNLGALAVSRDVSANVRVGGFLGKLSILGTWGGAGATPASLTVTGWDSKGVSLASAVVGRVGNATIAAPRLISKLSVAEWQDGGISAGGLGALAVAGDCAADVALTGAGVPLGKPVLGSATIAGRVTGGTWGVTGNVGKVSVGSAAGAWAVQASGDVASLSSVASLSGAWSSRSVRSVSAGGNIEDFAMTLTQAPDPKLLALGALTTRGWLDGCRVVSAGNIGKVAAVGMRDSSLFAGVAATRDVNGDGVLDLPVPATDIGASGASIASLAVSGVKGILPPADSFINSTVAAGILKSVVLSKVQKTPGWPLGLACHQILSLSYEGVATKLPAPFQDGDFELRVG